MRDTGKMLVAKVIKTGVGHALTSFPVLFSAQ